MCERPDLPDKHEAPGGIPARPRYSWIGAILNGKREKPAKAKRGDVLVAAE